ncbi:MULTISPECIES: hypothetical protein [unclassified Campylobacter]|uniref:hypothetical protein n=1 Tax=unclassified Campylobacter TaxID=2593542 RepID=UPI0022E9D90B|nr:MULTISPECIES: hypothetical protein [unclassified Campylobacter]MDA3079340.1 hypothetical protein [Campylobacter sp. CS_NA2]MDA3090174.1 hypothetical protein [Campylobacter sp. CS_ED2]
MDNKKAHCVLFWCDLCVRFIVRLVMFAFALWLWYLWLLCVRFCSVFTSQMVLFFLFLLCKGLCFYQYYD